MSALRGDRWLARVKAGEGVAPAGVVLVDTPGGAEALVVFDVPPTAVLGFDVVEDPAARAAVAYYRLRRWGAAEVLLSASLGDTWGILLDARWVRWFGA
ncbi:MAG: hypothetical protein ACK4YP_28340, partial [Myxococcota bacterium]